MSGMNLSSEARETSGDKGEKMKVKGNRTAWVRRAAAALLTSMLFGLALAGSANAAKIDNPSPPNFKAEITGGFLQFKGTAADAAPLQLDMDFAGYDPPLPNPTLTGSVTPNPAGYGVINVPQANIVFAPIPVNVDDISITIRILPTAAATGFIDPLSGRVDLALPIRLKAEGAAMGQNLGNDCYIGSAGNGTLNHLIGEMLGKATGIDLVHVPYKGAAAAVTDLVGGQVQVSVQSLPSSISFIKSGKIKVLGVVNEKRVPALPDSPTIGETVKGFGTTPWYGMFVPAGTPKAIVQQLNAEIAKALESKDAIERLAGVGCEPFKSTPEQFATLVRDDLPRWAKIVKDAGATVD